jgi:hypothetical protein
MKKIIFTTLLAFFAIASFGQAALFGVDSSIKPRSGFIISANFSYDIPFADMAKRFGNSFRLGPAITYKTKSNWLFGVKTDFIVGNMIKEDSLMINIKDKYSGAFNGKLVQLINSNGQRVGMPVYERGYMIGLAAGKIFSSNPERPDNGLTLVTSIGFMQHKINIYDKDVNVPQVDFAYKKGYDRLTNGAFVGQYVGYSYFAKNKLLNFNIGLDAAFGFTKGRRTYLFDVMRPDTKQRYDFLVGLKAGWMIPIFKRRSEDLSFE